MRAFLDDLSLIQHQDPVHLCDRRKTVGDCYDGFALHHPVERFLDRGFDFGIQRRCRFVQKQDRRILQDDARQSHALALAAG